MRVNGVDVDVLLGYRYWPAGIECGNCHGSYLALEKVRTDDTYIVRCWSGCKLRAAKDHPFMAMILGAFERKEYRDEPARI